jgi:alpha-tubulin suppressor-like RCC1 family protein
MSLRRPNGFISAGFNPLEVPNAPTIGTATSAGGTAVSVTFTAPSNVGGSAITGYVATARKTSDGTTISGTGASSPVTISGLTTSSAYTVTVAAVNSFGLGLSSAASNSVTPLAQELYVWGNNAYGQLGLNDLTNRNSPVQLGASTDWSKATTGRAFNLAIKTNGTLWAWGRNNSGQLGLGDTVNRSSPVQVGILTTWASVMGGVDHCVALRTDGTAWSWGAGAAGKLSQNNSADYSSPKQIGSGTSWAKAVAGYSNTALISTSGALFICGQGTWGVNGTNNVYAQNFIQFVSTGWSDISISGRNALARKTGGTMWAWGGNNKGQLGLNNATSYSSPVQIGALTTWSKISASGTYSFDNAAAIKTDGTMWSWGSNFRGSLGLNDSYDRSSPVQIGALTTWSEVAAGFIFFRALKTDGTFWNWGNNSYGQLGQGNTTYRSSPVQVGALTTWSVLPIGVSGQNSAAITKG